MVQALSGSVEDINAAIQQAINTGETVVNIPAGRFAFAADGAYNVSFPGGFSIFGAGKDLTILDLPDEVTTPSTNMFETFAGYLPVRVSGIRFIGRTAIGSETGDTAIAIRDSENFRVDNCAAEWMGGTMVHVADPGREDRTQGVIDHCDLLNIYKPEATAAGQGFGYGVAVIKDWNTVLTPWESDPTKILGKYKGNTFVEDNLLYNCRHAVMDFAGGSYVARYNAIVNDWLHRSMHQIDQHPARGPSTGNYFTFSGRSAEVYNNSITALDAIDQPEKYPPDWTCPACGLGISARHSRIQGLHTGGGCGVWYNNTLKHLNWAYFLEGAETANPNALICWIKDFYIWNNTIIDILDSSIRGVANQGKLPVEWDGQGDEPDTWYRLKPPTWYTPYTYPHPLVTGVKYHNLSISSSPITNVPFEIRRVG